MHCKASHFLLPLYSPLIPLKILSINFSFFDQIDAHEFKLG